MKTTGSARDRQRGVALLVALLALLLLSAIGLGMMYSSDTDTVINANYRDKQLAMYASMAGVQEARDRIQPQNTVANIPFPTGLPAMTAQNIIYILNPKNGETVTPWDNTNPTKDYFDDELCQENVLSLSGTAGVPCTGPYPNTHAAWTLVYDDSQTSAAPWNLASPLYVKWTRITLKANNMTPVYPDGAGTGSNSTQICWDGHQQILLPAGYGPNCGPLTSSVATVTLTNPGTGYTSAPTVTLSGGGGSGASAVAVGSPIPNGQVGSVTVTAPGANYTSAPTVTFSGGGGTGAAATAVIQPANGAPVASLSVTSPGTQCFLSSSPPSVIISGGGGAGAAGSATVASGNTCLYSLQVTATCKQGDAITYTISGGNGSGATVNTVTAPNPNGGGATITFTANPVVNLPGTGYDGSAITVSATGPHQACTNVSNVATFGNLLQSLTVTAGGGGYTTPPAVTVGGGAGVGATAPTATSTLGPISANAGQVIGVTVTSGGSGYTSAPSVTFSGGSGSGAAATAVLGSTYTLTGVNVTAGGSGYTSAPTVVLSGGGGSGATAYASLAEGLYYGQVFLLTSMAQTPSGARAMTQSEVTTPVRGISLTGALTVDGPNPTMGALPNSSNFFVNGADANSCGQTADPAHPAIGAYDDPNASPPTTSVADITAAIPSGRTSDYMGSGPSPDVQNVFGALGDSMSSPAALYTLVQQMPSWSTNTYGTNPSSIALGSAGSPVTDFVNGDLTLSGSNTGYGILFVTGTLNFGGDFSWNGLVFVVGDGVLVFNGGGSGQINGSVIVANIWDSSHTLLSSMGSPNISWVGGGGNGIHYDHCWADNMLSKIPWVPPASNKQLLVLSTRTVSY